MKVFKCKNVNVEVDTEYRRYTGVELATSAPEGLYRHFKANQKWRYLVLVDRRNKRCVIHIDDNGTCITGAHPTSMEERYVLVEDARVYLEIKE